MKVNEIFFSLQGEGKYIGMPQVFIRTAGCNFRCSWCDTWYSRAYGEEMNVKEILDEIGKYNVKSVCITGGEPMLHLDDLKKLVRELKNKGYFILLETNGSLYDKYIFNKVDCVSMDIKPPSSGERSNEILIKKLKEKDQIKIVIADDTDYEYAKKIAKKSRISIILQPKGGIKIKELTDRVLKDRLNVRVLPQLHKIINIK